MNEAKRGFALSLITASGMVLININCTDFQRDTTEMTSFLRLYLLVAT